MDRDKSVKATIAFNFEQLSISHTAGIPSGIE